MSSCSILWVFFLFLLTAIQTQIDTIYKYFQLTRVYVRYTNLCLRFQTLIFSVIYANVNKLID